MSMMSKPSAQSPMPPAARSAVGLRNWLQHPNGKFSYLNAAEFVPTAVIMPQTLAGLRAPKPGPLAAARLVLPDGSSAPASDVLAGMEMDSLLISKAGEIVVETHAPHVDAVRPHLLFSVSKSITGLLAGIVVGDGKLAEADTVGALVGELAGSGFATATVRDLLDMTVDVAFNEDYVDPASDFNRYRRAVLWDEPLGPRETMLGVLASVGSGPVGHGRRFSYISCVTDVLGLVLERATGRRYVDLLRDRLLHPLGCADAVTVAVDGEGHSRATGGVSMTARDLMRIGQLVASGGKAADGAQLVPEAWIDDLSGGATRQAWIDGEFPDMLPVGNYRSCWYDLQSGKGPIAALGIFGQFIWIDRTSDIVIVCLSSRPVMSDPDLSKHGLELLAQLAGCV